MKNSVMKYHNVLQISSLFLSDFEDSIYETNLDIKFMFQKCSDDIYKITGIKNDFLRCDYNFSKNMILSSEFPKILLCMMMNDLIALLEKRYHCHMNDIGEE